MAPSDLVISVEAAADGSRVIVLHGDVDMVSAPLLKEAIEAHIEGDLHLDVAGVEFMDSSGLAILTRAERAARARGSRLVIHGASGGVKRLLDLTGMSGFLTLDEEAPDPHRS